METSATENLRVRGRNALARRIGIDTRALAVFRISLGTLLLADLFLRFQNLVAFYTDAGILPISVLETRFSRFSRLSIHALSGAVWFQAALFVVAGIFALALLMGYRTKLATVVSFALLVSLHARNPVLLNAGDSILRRLLLWSIFLPLGERYSIDSLHGDGHERRVVSLASAGILFQVVTVYAVNALFKLRGDLWIRGVAVQYVFSLHNLTTVVGEFFANYSLLPRVFDELWFAMVISSVLLLLLTGWPRAAFVSLFVAMHFGMLLTMRLGLFPLISITALLPFLPSVVWDAATRFTESMVSSRWIARCESRCKRAFPTISFARTPTVISEWGHRIAPLVVASFLLFILVWNAASLGYARTPDEVSDVVNPTDHRWSMFAPEPRDTDGWYVVPGTLESGRRLDAFRGSAVRWSRPSRADMGFPSHRWLVYLLDLQRPGYETLRPAFADYVCHRWNRNHDDDLVDVSVYYVRQPTNLDGQEPTRRVELADRSCATG